MKCDVSTALYSSGRGDRQRVERKYAKETYSDDDRSIVVPFTVILLGDPRIHETKLLLVFILERFIDICECPPADFVPVGDRGNLGDGVEAWKLLRDIFGLFLVHVFDGDGRDCTSASSVDSDLWKKEVCMEKEEP